ncbi:MAG: hypothetical protein WD557_07195 [Dehalococcoidia bacterium]
MERKGGRSLPFRGERDVVIEPVGEGAVSVTHIEDVRGWLAPIFAVVMGGPVQASHDAMNAALRSRC